MLNGALIMRDRLRLFLFALALPLAACSGASDPGVGSGGHDPANPTPGDGSGGGGTSTGGGSASGNGTTTGSGSGNNSGSGTTGGSSTGSSGSSGSGSGAQKGPIRIQNVSYTKPSANHLVVTFTVTNTGSSERLEQVDLANVAVGGGGIDFRFSACPSTTPSYMWSLLPGETSDILTVDVVAGGNGGEIDYPCSYGEPSIAAASNASWPALSGAVTLTLKGIMSDASPWTAVAQGNER